MKTRQGRETKSVAEGEKPPVVVPPVAPPIQVQLVADS